MNKAQKVVFGFLSIAIIVIAVLIVISIRVPHNYFTCSNTGIEGTVFYYGVTCPHCKIVEEFMTENNVLEKINLVQKEVYQNQTNANELINLGRNCNLPGDYIGAVPLLYENNKAYVGDKDIIDFLKQKIGVD
jgi:hypothetical protein